MGISPEERRRILESTFREWQKYLRSFARVIYLLIFLLIAGLAALLVHAVHDLQSQVIFVLLALAVGAMLLRDYFITVKQEGPPSNLLGIVIGRLLTWLGFDRMLGRAFDKLGIPETMEFKKTLTRTVTREIQPPPAELEQLLSHAHRIRDLSDLPPELAANPEVQKVLSQAKSTGGPYPASFEANLPPELARDPQVQELLKEGKPLIFTSTDVKDLPPEVANDLKIRTYAKLASGNWSPLRSKAFSWALLVVLGATVAFSIAALLSLVKQLPGSR